MHAHGSSRVASVQLACRDALLEANVLAESQPQLGHDVEEHRRRAGCHRAGAAAACDLEVNDTWLAAVAAVVVSRHDVSPWEHGGRWAERDLIAGDREGGVGIECGGGTGCVWKLTSTKKSGRRRQGRWAQRRREFPRRCDGRGHTVDHDRVGPGLAAVAVLVIRPPRGPRQDAMRLRTRDRRR
jgi:hypothetical protein